MIRDFSMPFLQMFDFFPKCFKNEVWILQDLDFVRFILNCLKYYYPGVLAYLLVLEIPWVLNAAWRIVKSWLDSSAQKKIIFVDKKAIKEYIDPDNLPPHVGGNVTILYFLE